MAGASTTLKKLFDINGAVGGPIKQDKLWFYVTSRYFTNEFYLAGLVLRARPDRDSPRGGSVQPGIRRNVYLRQQRARDLGDQRQAEVHRVVRLPVQGRSALDDRRGNHCAGGRARHDVAHAAVDIKWTYTATNRLLFEAGIAPGASPDTIIAEPDRINGISIQEQGSPVGSTLGIRPLIYRAPQGFDFDDRLPSQSIATSMSYVPAAHSVKIGMDMQRGYFWRGDNNESTGGIWYRTREYVPNLVTIQAPNAGWQNNLNYNLGIYAQDRWTMNRLTLSGGIRLDYAERVHLRFQVAAASLDADPRRALPRGQERPELEGHQPARLGRLRPLRHRQDRAQGEREPRRGAGLDPLRGGQQSREHARHAGQPRVERHEQQLRARLRPPQPAAER